MEYLAVSDGLSPKPWGLTQVVLIYNDKIVRRNARNFCQLGDATVLEIVVSVDS
jgi:hypothetical protein